ncbi:MAG: hypothetical protein ACRD3N_06350 [Terracidiphilus sp.]
MSISRHKLYPATAELHRHARRHELPEIQRLAALVREDKAIPPHRALPLSNDEDALLTDNDIGTEAPVSDNQ